LAATAQEAPAKKEASRPHPKHVHSQEKGTSGAAPVPTQAERERSEKSAQRLRHDHTRDGK
jgi:hypothetical protein